MPLWFVGGKRDASPKKTYPNIIQDLLEMLQLGFSSQKGSRRRLQIKKISMWDFSFTSICLKVDTIFFHRHSNPSLHPHRFQLEIKWEWPTSSEQARCEEIRKKSSHSHMGSGHWCGAHQGLALESICEGPACSPVSQPCQSNSGSIVLWPSCDYIFPHSTITFTSTLSTHTRMWPPWSWTWLWHSMIFLHGGWWSACLAAMTGYTTKQLLKASFCLIALEHSLSWKRKRVAVASTVRKQGDKDTHIQLFSFIFSLGLKFMELYCSYLGVGLSIPIHSRNSLMDMLRGLFP